MLQLCTNLSHIIHKDINWCWRWPVNLYNNHLTWFTYLYNNNFQLSVDFSYCWFNLVEVWYSLEQYIGLKEDKLSSTTVDFIRSEGNLETKHLYWFSKPKMC